MSISVRIHYWREFHLRFHPGVQITCGTFCAIASSLAGQREKWMSRERSFERERRRIFFSFLYFTRPPLLLVSHPLRVCAIAQISSWYPLQLHCIWSMPFIHTVKMAFTVTGVSLCPNLRRKCVRLMEKKGGGGRVRGWGWKRRWKWLAMSDKQLIWKCLMVREHGSRMDGWWGFCLLGWWISWRQVVKLPCGW